MLGKSSRDDSRCQYCGEKLPLFQRLSKAGFCNPQHKEQFHRQQDELAIGRLQAAERSPLPVSAAVPQERQIPVTPELAGAAEPAESKAARPASEPVQPEIRQNKREQAHAKSKAESRQAKPVAAAAPAATDSELEPPPPPAPAPSVAPQEAAPFPLAPLMTGWAAKGSLKARPTGLQGLDIPQGKLCHPRGALEPIAPRLTPSGGTRGFVWMLRPNENGGNEHVRVEAGWQGPEGVRYPSVPPRPFLWDKIIERERKLMEGIPPMAGLMRLPGPQTLRFEAKLIRPVASPEHPSAAPVRVYNPTAARGGSPRMAGTVRGLGAWRTRFGSEGNTKPQWDGQWVMVPANSASVRRAPVKRSVTLWADQTTQMFAAGGAGDGFGGGYGDGYGQGQGEGAGDGDGFAYGYSDQGGLGEGESVVEFGGGWGESEPPPVPMVSAGIALPAATVAAAASTAVESEATGTAGSTQGQSQGSQPQESSGSAASNSPGTAAMAAGAAASGQSRKGAGGAARPAEFEPESLMAGLAFLDLGRQAGSSKSAGGKGLGGGAGSSSGNGRGRGGKFSRTAYRDLDLPLGKMGALPQVEPAIGWRNLTEGCALRLPDAGPAWLWEPVPVPTQAGAQSCCPTEQNAETVEVEPRNVSSSRVEPQHGSLCLPGSGLQVRPPEFWAHIAVPADPESSLRQGEMASVPPTEVQPVLPPSIVNAAAAGGSLKTGDAATWPSRWLTPKSSAIEDGPGVVWRMRIAGGPGGFPSGPAALPTDLATRPQELVYRVELGRLQPLEPADGVKPVTGDKPVGRHVRPERAKAVAESAGSGSQLLVNRRELRFRAALPPSRPTRFEGLRISRLAPQPDLEPAWCPFGSGGTEEDTYGSH